MNEIEMKNLRNAIKADGNGAPERWAVIASGAMGGNEAAQVECERLIGHPASMPEWYAIITAAYDVMSKREVESSAAHAKQALNARYPASREAEAYLNNRIGALRRERGLTQQQLATASGIPLTTIQKLENGTNRIINARAITVLALAKALGLTMEELLDAEKD